jgi:hypothetical protein
LKKLRCPIKGVMEVTKYVLKILVTKVSIISLLMRSAAELIFALSLNRPIKTRNRNADMVKIRIKL